METLLDGVNHIALLTRDMDRFIRFYQEVFDAQVVHDNRHHAGHVGERMVIMALGGQSTFNVFEVPGNTQAQIQTPCLGVAVSTILASMPGAGRPSSKRAPVSCT